MVKKGFCIQGSDWWSPYKKIINRKRVNNEKEPSGRWYTGCGIYRHTWLKIKNPVHVSHWGTYVTTPEINSDKASISIKTSLTNDRNKKQEITLDWRKFLKRGNFENIYELRRKIAEEGGEEENRIVNRRSNEDRRVEIQYQNGRKEIYYERGGIMVITPENDTIRPQIPLMAVMNLVPPIPDEPEIDKWFEILNANMDSIVQHLVDDEESFSNYKASLSEYSSAERVNKAMRMIDFLIIE